MLKLKNRFPSLADTNNECDMDIKWKNFNKTYVETATAVLGFRKESEIGMDNTRHKEEDWGKETPEGQYTEHNITEAPRAGPASL